MKSQNQKLLKQFKKGVWLTPWKAINQFKITRFSARILELKKGHEFDEKWVKHNGKRFKAFRLTL